MAVGWQLRHDADDGSAGRNRRRRRRASANRINVLKDLRDELD
jgi:hypothetical protein